MGRPLIWLCFWLAVPQPQPPAHVANRGAIFSAGLWWPAFFAIMIAMRAFDWEDSFRQVMRRSLRADQAYESRRDFQRPMVAAAVVVFACLAMWMVSHVVRAAGSRRRIALACASLATLALAGLLILRIISLHQIDRLLYGPLKLNWLGDIGLSVTALAAAVYYIRVLTKRA